MTTTPPPGPTHTPGGFGNDPRLGAAALRAPAASREDSHPQTILKFHCPSILDYSFSYLQRRKQSEAKVEKIRA